MKFLEELCACLIEASQDPDVFTKDSKPYLIWQGAIEELNRLEAHPALFPNETAMTSFLAIVDEIRREKEDEEQSREYLVKVNELAQEEDEVIDKINRPMFKPGLKPWEQFLLKDSPGCGLKIPDHPAHMFFQVMPFAGSLIRDRWLRTSKEIETRVTKVRSTELHLILSFNLAC